ncbi:hypothetical protein T440DRAFT_545032 [Plenodomus tracheiphilus IPT5]|uniref:BTB domain-containing protein n=1 Tax=Plenodomus tracheiphilus IPT5 TaxID=1408161 RepID=A0A6A7AQL8_9PLEO|nr:hypothetical protein T440DRAFT_545032 [Plenodomus tracheiphilus IPT5]
MTSRFLLRRLPALHQNTMITFVLSGRTTLSEHLPSETIDVPLAIASRSPQLLAVIERHISNPNTIPLPSVDPAGFKLFLDYLNSASKTLPLFAFPTTLYCSLRECIDLIYAHIVGGTLKEPEFQDYVIDEMSQILSPKQSLDQKILDVVFVDRKVSDVLKKFVMDKMFAEDRKLVSMLRGGYEDVSYATDGTSECEYHVHNKGACYRRTSAIKASKEMGKGKLWCADEDPELQARAEYCLSHIKDTSIGKMHRNDVTTKRIERVNHQHRRRSSERMHTLKLDDHDLCMRQGGSSGMDSEKPLPALPTSSNSSTVSLSSTERPSIFPTSNRDSEYTAAWTNKSQSDSHAGLYPVATADANVRDIVAECLDRFTRSSSAMETTHREDTFGTSSTVKRPAVPCIFDVPLSLKPGSPPTSPSNQDFLAGQLRSSTELFPCLIGNLGSPVATYAAPSFVRRSSLYLPPLVKRKAVPPRGNDWLEQWDRLHALRGTEGFGQRRSVKQERRSLLHDIADSIRRPAHQT